MDSKQQLQYHLHACVLSHFSHVRLCDGVDCSPPGSTVHGILQARILEQVAMSSSRGSSLPRDRTQVSYVSCIVRQVLYHQCPWGSPQKRYIYTCIQVDMYMCVYIHIYSNFLYQETIITKNYVKNRKDSDLLDFQVCYSLVSSPFVILMPLNLTNKLDSICWIS